MKLNLKLLIPAIIIAIVLIGTSYILLSKQNEETENNTTAQTSSNVESENANYKASFAIYTNGTFRIFTAPMYHNLSADVFIEASNPNIVNVKKSNISWRGFFKTLPFELDENCLTTGTKQTFCTNENDVLQFYLNEDRNQSALDQIINPGDKLLVTYDKENSSAIAQQLQSIPSSE